MIIHDGAEPQRSVTLPWKSFFPAICKHVVAELPLWHVQRFVQHLLATLILAICIQPYPARHKLIRQELCRSWLLSHSSLAPCAAIPSSWLTAPGPAATSGGPTADSIPLTSATAAPPFSAAATVAAATATAAAMPGHGTPPLEGGGTAMDAVTWLMDQPPLPSHASLADGVAVASAPWYDTSVFDLLDIGGGDNCGGGGGGTVAAATKSF